MQWMFQLQIVLVSQAMRKLYFYLIVFSGLLSCSEKKEKTQAHPQERSRTVVADAFIVKTIPLSENIEVGGSLMPAEGTDIRPEISGRLKGNIISQAVRR